MSRFYSYLNSATKILSDYKGEVPLSVFLKSFFRQHKKYGSRDRREIGNLCYCYFRLGKSLPEIEIEERILLGLFLCSSESSPILNVAKPEWSGRVKMELDEKLKFLNLESIPSKVFPFENELSNGINVKEFAESFFIQPNLFLRLRPTREQLVLKGLRENNIELETLSHSTLAIPNSRKVDQVIELDKDAVVQDLSSQNIGGSLKDILGQKPISVWDCCAASGGKSILAFDLNSNIKLTVSDIRQSILSNLKKRFSYAGIRNYTSFEVNLEFPHKRIRNAPFDLVIADVPCTGSGTWSRTPEQLFYFETSKINDYVLLQRNIVANAIPHLKIDGYLAYITCSVFKKENEENVDFFRANYDLEEVKREELIGYNQKADSMFISVLKKNIS